MARTARRHVERGPRRRLVAELMRLADDRAELVSHAERPWSSITFSGARHTLVLHFEGSEAIEAGEHLIAALPDHEFTIPGQLVADAVIVKVDHVTLPEAVLTVEAELLLLEEC
ncbi:MAG: hypothetical protein R3D89_08935 [Sphingomonadaceae bacterium]